MEIFLETLAKSHGITGLYCPFVISFGFGEAGSFSVFTKLDID